MVTWNLHCRNDDVDGPSNWLIMIAAVRFCPSGFTPWTVANFGLFGTPNSVGTAVHFRKFLPF